MRGIQATCPHCSLTFVKKRLDQIFCSSACSKKGHWKTRPQSHQPSTDRTCRHCGNLFVAQGQSDSNRQYCSIECSREGARKSRREFRQRNPGYGPGPNGKPDTRKRPNPGMLVRLRRKYPDLPSACESCGEARIVEIAHKPAFARRGRWPSMDVMQRHMFWILCPTCHALIDRANYTPEALGLT